MELHYTIPLDPRTKKNHQRIVGTGRRCPACGKAERLYVMQGKAHDAYEKKALWFLRPKPAEPVTTPVRVRVHFYMQTRRRVDSTNLIAAVDDLLVEAGILADDHSAVLIHHDGTRVFHDKQAPRTEIWITDYNESEDPYVHPNDLHT